MDTHALAHADTHACTHAHAQARAHTHTHKHTHTQVDIIISEWLGYALFYESMLDTVLDARRREPKICSARAQGEQLGDIAASAVLMI